MKVNERYDAFQRDAVNNILADFGRDAKGRFLLVIPTGGGKTTTAVKAVSGMFDANLLGPNDRVMWVVHRDELRNQARDAFAQFAESTKKPELPGRIDILMLSEVEQYLFNNPGARFAVIDEAHHVAAKSYQPLFVRTGLGILGLTATPSRHDKQPLQFTRESYSIGFPDLVSIGVLLRPNVIQVEGGKYDISDISDDSDALEILNNDQRNDRIVKALIEHSAKIHKALIYVGTRKHAQDLYQLLKSSEKLASKYESIGLILGNERRRYVSATKREIEGELRKDFMAAQKASSRSMLVNVDVLTEGYDDPTVNAIVMARPTSSKLVYIQAIGRAVRIDPQNEAKETYVIEVTDDLPNIKYRIDNRWLYSDISDQLEPNVIDVFYPSYNELHSQIEEIFERFHVKPEYRIIPEYSPRDRVTMLLFKVYAGSNAYENVPIVITNETRQAAAGFFNLLAARMKQLHGLDIEQIFRPVIALATRFKVLEAASVRKNVFNAMENAWDLLAGVTGGVSPQIEAGRPWITFVCLRLQMSEEALGADLLQFTEDMLNRELVREALRTGSIAGDFMLVKFPLPLRGTWGEFMPPAEFAMLKETVEKLGTYVSEPDGTHQWQAAVSVIGTATVTIEQRHMQSLTTIVRERIDYFRPIDRQSLRRAN